MDSHAALLVGATGGIGRGLADALVDEGFAVTITGRDEPALADLTATLTARGASVSSEVFDLAQPRRAADVVASHLRRWGRLDVLVVSSGISRRELLADADPDRTRRVIDTNLSAVVDVVSAALVPLRARGQHGGGGLVVLLSSLVARRPLAGFGVYSATKAAVSALVRSINEEEGSHGVRATALCPGFVDTALTAPLRETLSQPMLTTSDIADAVRFLVRLSPAVCVPELELARVGVTGGRP
jgi:NADP-dependent 3-hydroxy acid dehydrogenase YdfG